MRSLSGLTDVAALLMVAWAGLLAAGHLVAAFGIARRASWARRLGLVMGGIGLFGSLAVLVTLIPGLDRAEAVIGQSPLLVLAIPAGMVLTYALIVVVLFRTRLEFSLEVE